MISSGVLGEQRRRQGGVVGVIRVRGVDEPVGVAGRQERAGWPGAVEQGRGSCRHRYPGREDQRCAQGRARGPHRRRQTRQQALRLRRGGGYPPPLLVAGCNRWTLMSAVSSPRLFRGLPFLPEAAFSIES